MPFLNLLVPDGGGLAVDLCLLGLRILTGVAFLQHGLPKLRHLAAWSAMMQKPQWLCALSAGSMLLGGLALLPGLLTVPAALAIAVSMAYAVLFLNGHGAPFIPPEPFELPKGDYMGSRGPGEPASWEKAAMYVAICALLMAAGAGSFSLDKAWLLPLLQSF